MAAILECDIETLGKRLTTGLEAGLEKAIHDELIKQADVIVSKLAKTMAKNLRGNITAYRDFAGDRINVVLVLDGASDLPNVLGSNVQVQRDSGGLIAGGSAGTTGSGEAT